jgi:hypothetical protein
MIGIMEQWVGCLFRGDRDNASDIGHGDTKFSTEADDGPARIYGAALGALQSEGESVRAAGGQMREPWREASVQLPVATSRNKAIRMSSERLLASILAITLER